MPRVHRQSVFDLTTDKFVSTFSLLTEVKALIDAEYNPQGYNVSWNCGAIAGQTAFHVMSPSLIQVKEFVTGSSRNLISITSDKPLLKTSLS